MEIGKKWLAVIIILAIVLTAFSFAVIFNVGGLGSSLAGAGGPIASGFYNLLVTPLNWALSGGWPTLAVFFLIGFVAFPCLLAYLVWHNDIPYKILGQPGATTGNYQNAPSQNIIPLQDMQNAPTKKSE